MMNGASTLEGYVPDVDATVVTRILDAGGTIVGKAHCEYFCLSGGSHTSRPARSTTRTSCGYSAGGSSSRLRRAGRRRRGRDGDRRRPGRLDPHARLASAACYGMKPTHGLVPYTGVMPIEATIDHTGPMTTTVADNALLLEVHRRSRRARPAPVQRARRQLHGGARPRRRRAADRRGDRRLPATTTASPTSMQKVRQAAERLRGLGAIVEEVSIPMHLDGLGDLDADRARGPAGADDERQRHGLQLEGPVHDQPARRPRQLARPAPTSCRAR